LGRSRKSKKGEKEETPQSSGAKLSGTTGRRKTVSQFLSFFLRRVKRNHDQRSGIERFSFGDEGRKGISTLSPYRKKNKKEFQNGGRRKKGKKREPGELLTLHFKGMRGSSVVAFRGGGLVSSSGRNRKAMTFRRRKGDLYAKEK